MESITEALRYAIPALVVLAATYMMLKAFFNEEHKRRQQALMLERIRISLPLRLQAYERLVLMLERLDPQNLVVRLHQPGLSAPAFHRQLVLTVREEFSHNMSQQVYVSAAAWDMIKSAKEEIVRQINTAAAKLDNKATATDLSNNILEITVEKQTVAKTIAYIKDELARVF